MLVEIIWKQLIQMLVAEVVTVLANLEYLCVSAVVVLVLPTALSVEPCGQ